MNFTFALITTAEELLEMLGIVLYIYALAGYYPEHIERSAVNIHLKVATSSGKLPEPVYKSTNQQPVAYEVVNQIVN